MAAEAQFHVLAVDDSLIDRTLIERLLKTSSYHGNLSSISLLSWYKERSFFVFAYWFSWILIVYLLWACFISAVTAVDSGTKALEFLGFHDDEQNETETHSVSPNDHRQVYDPLIFSLNLQFLRYCV